MIDALATLPHYRDHVAPIWEALPAELRGTLYLSKGLRTCSIPTLCASYRDLVIARKARRPVILMEHGSGQSYAGTSAKAYIGGADRDGVIAVLVPGERQAAQHRAVHPELPAFVIGCPKLDTMRAGGTETVTSFHWDCRAVCPETRNALPFYLRHLRRIGGIGHAHPRLWPTMPPKYRREGLEPVEHFADAIARAGVYVCDNSSTIFEAAVLDVPLVILNAPWYRRDVEHGMRFWEYADVGVQVDHPFELADAVAEARADRPAQATRRREIAAEVYAHRGHATRAAVGALEEITAWASPLGS